jgi:acetyltransferase-like isoleucine patch superfamily enzyme
MVELIYSIAEKAAGFAKGRPYKIDRGIAFGDLLAFCSGKVIALLRGALAFRVRTPCFVGKSVRITCRRKIRLGRGVNIGDYVCLDALSKDGITLADGSAIGDYTIVRATGVLGEIGVGFRLGTGSSLGPFGYVGASGGVEIGSKVIAGQRVSFHSENHVFSDLRKPIKDQGVTREGIFIGDNCWIGAAATFLDGVRLGEGCVVAAGSVVTRGSYPSNSVIGGVPAKILKNRDESSSGVFARESAVSV